MLSCFEYTMPLKDSNEKELAIGLYVAARFLAGNLNERFGAAVTEDDIQTELPNKLSVDFEAHGIPRRKALIFLQTN